MNLTRREFICHFSYGGALLLAMPYATSKMVKAAENNVPARQTELSPLIKISEHNKITFFYPSPEMGQGTDISLAMLFMEELGGDMSTLSVEPLPYSIMRNAEGNIVFRAVPQGAGGSTSIPRNWPLLREAGATARQLLLQAAAAYWSKPISSLSVRNSYVLDDAGRELPFGALTELAAQQTLPEDFSPKLKSSADWDVIGRSHNSPQLHKIVTGKPLYGMDMEYPGAKVAVIARSPFFDGQVAKLDAEKAKKLSGVLGVYVLPRPDINKMFTYLAGGVAVVAEDFWTAKQARDLLNITWDKGPHYQENTLDVEKQCNNLLKGSGQVVRQDGQFGQAMASASKVIEHSYQIPMVSHAQLEPQNCIAHVTKDNCTIIGPMQSPSGASRLAEAITGFDRVNMDIRYTRLGGGFGRRLTSDHVAEAVTVAKMSGLPIKLIWTREDDMCHDFYRPMSHHRLTAGIDDNGQVIAWSHKLAGTPKYYRRDNVKPEDMFRADMYIDDFPAGIVPNLHYEYCRAESGAPQGSWRAPAHTANCFAVQSFLNDVARETNQDPVALRLAMLGEPRKLDYAQHGGPVFDTGRMSKVIKAVAELSDWGRSMPENRGLGIAGHFTFGGYCAQVVEVERVGADGIKVLNVFCALDVGIPVNPAGLIAQIEGGINDGLSTAMGQKVKVENGQVVSTNFDTYPMLRIGESAIEIKTVLIESDAEPSGAGEMTIPPLAPALADAIASAGGPIVRQHPMKDEIRRMAS